MKEFRLFVQSMYDRSVGFYETFGISVFENNEITRIIRDISVDRGKVEALAAQCNAEQPDAAHLDQVIEDFLCDFTV